MLTEMGTDYFAAKSSSAFSFAYLKAPNTAQPSQTKTLRWNYSEIEICRATWWLLEKLGVRGA